MKGKEVHEALMCIGLPDLQEAINAEWPRVLQPWSRKASMTIPEGFVRLSKLEGKNGEGEAHYLAKID